MIKDRIHFHAHRHVNGALHFHAHSHAGEKGHGPDHHCHDHSRDFPLRALFVGSMHGMAGSAALILLTLQAVETPMQGLLYIALFGAGSILSMLGLSAVIAVPLRLSGMGQRLTWLHMGLQATIGIVTMAMGTMLAYQIGVIDGFFVQ
jgi:ABC-type nickel/cobalt efflux system permease component RcnA